MRAWPYINSSNIGFISSIYFALTRFSFWIIGGFTVFLSLIMISYAPIYEVYGLCSRMGVYNAISWTGSYSIRHQWYYRQHPVAMLWIGYKTPLNNRPSQHKLMSIYQIFFLIGKEVTSWYGLSAAEDELLWSDCSLQDEEIPCDSEPKGN